LKTDILAKKWTEIASQVAECRGEVLPLAVGAFLQTGSSRERLRPEKPGEAFDEFGNVNGLIRTRERE